MCGIAGTFGADSPEPGKWLPYLRHRGPDGEGTWTSLSGYASLAHTRLAIIDPLPEAAQPMSSPCGRWHLVFNGEIYNFRELRARLEGEGIRCATASDTEVLLHGLARHGKTYLDCLAGMFAIGFWDETEQRGLLARDPFGIKPLYLRAHGDGSMSFASEVRALQQVAGKGAVDILAVTEHLRWGSVAEPLTLDRSVRQLRSGHVLEWDRKGHTETAFARIGFDPNRNAGNRSPGNGGDRGRMGSAEAARTTRRALLESMERHLVSDVPLGLFLSGGIDSAVVLALARERLGREAEIRTFSIGFEDPTYDESALARRLADRFGANHTEWILTREEGLAEIPGYLEAMDQPTNDGFNTWCISRLARREGVKVALSGLGGDEMFGGYASFRRVPWLRRLHRALGPVRMPAATGLRRAKPDPRWRRVAAFLEGNNKWWDAFHVQRGFFTRDEAGALVETIFGASGDGSEFDTRFVRDDPAEFAGTARDSVSWMELTGYLRNQLLRDSDVFSMAQGLEIRVPLVDWRLFQTLAGIPAAIRLRKGKRLLLDAVPELPQWVGDRPKQGFRFPFEEWMEDGFGEMTSQADRLAGEDLGRWYRRWTLSALLHRWNTEPDAPRETQVLPVR